MTEKNRNKFSIRKRLKSFHFAFNGLRILWKEEHNFRLHILASVLVVIAGSVFGISPFEWIAVTLAIGLVLTAEILNTSIENLADVVSPGKHEKIKKVKDLAAGSVLVVALVALVVGLVVFLPRIVGLL